MNVVGKVGSLISQGVYSVATPFHPFGGAVDIIVVEQEDGTYRSTPWYVRFGKFQGVLKGSEKVVTITVNGVEANFHMCLENSGEAYFMREVIPGSKDEKNEQDLDDSGYVEGNELGRNGDGNHHSFDESEDATDNNEHGLQDDGLSQENGGEAADYGSYHYGSLDDVESVVDASEHTNSEMVLVSVDGHVLTAPISSNMENTDNLQLSTPQFHLGPGEGSGDEFRSNRDAWNDGLYCDIDVSSPKNSNYSDYQFESVKDTRVVSISETEKEVSIMRNADAGSMEVIVDMNRDDKFQSCLDLTSHEQEVDSEGVGSPSIGSETKDSFVHSPRISSFSDQTLEEGKRDSPNFRIGSPLPLPNLGLPCDEKTLSVGIDIVVSETNVCGDSNPKEDQLRAIQYLMDSELLTCNGLSERKDKVKDSDVANGNPDIGCASVISTGEDPEENDKGAENINGRPFTVEECSKSSECDKIISGLGLEISMCGNLLRSGMGQKSAEEVFEAHRISKEQFEASGATFVKNGNLVVRWKDRYVLWEKAAHIVLGMAVFGSEFVVDPKDSIPVENDDALKGREDAAPVTPSFSRRWRLWPIPFRRVKSIQHSDDGSSNEDLFLDSESGLQEHVEQSPTSHNSPTHSKQLLRTKIPTTEQIASLNLKDGQNMIAFSFSTRVLGKQQVDAHIYLWKWNTRIVISDVDGTITKSDVLGQFMPLVGRDWTQSGVARLFSAIRENGYQLLFLSARAIVQAYLTRSFLLNLKQDGKALPNGPVVISPDGLFPSLYREVIRRAPHEFKIACLEDIRALFPSDYNPFYAGFGNRDTDELSYRKIGIPKGKIFIINPKGEVAINHCIDVKSYTSLHTLVNDMFPPTSLVEQEDFNSWNYWKMPLPNIDC
ncbi:putative phosphatidate phosphatase [Dioscorea sansibarensis]